MIFDNKKNESKNLGVSFDNHLEVYGSPTAHKSAKTNAFKRKVPSHIRNGKIKRGQEKTNNIRFCGEAQEKESIPNSCFVNSTETVGILINKKELANLSNISRKRKINEGIEQPGETKSDNADKTLEISDYDKSDKIKGKSDLLFKKREDKFNLIVDKQKELLKGKLIVGKNIENIFDMFSEKDAHLGNYKYPNSNKIFIDVSKSKQTSSDKYAESRTHHDVNYENKYDFLCYMAKEYGKVLCKNINQYNTDENQTTILSEMKIQEALPDEENNYKAYCDEFSWKFQVHVDPNMSAPENSNGNKIPQSSVKCRRKIKNDISKRNFEFRCEEAKRQSELDAANFTEEYSKLDLIPCNIPVDKGFFIDIIYFNENRKGVLTNKTIDHARRTGSLQLCNKSLTEVPHGIWSLNNKDDELPYEFAKGPDKWRGVLQTIVNMNISFNKLKDAIPNGSSVCTIKELRLNNNRIEELPDEIGQLQFLSYLNLSFNRLRILPLKLCCLRNLEEINLRRNFLQKLPETFGNLIKLRKADLSFNKMSKLPASFVTLSNLLFLDLSFNELIQLPTRLMYLKRLQNVCISYNYLSELPPMVDMVHLTFFDSTCNRLRHFPNFSGCIHLTELRLGLNQIKEIVVENLHRCPMTNLNLSHNKIEVIPDEISVLTRIEILDLSDNFIVMLPWTLARLQHLTYVKVDNNKITNLKKSVLEENPQSVLEILRNRLILYEGKDSPILKQVAKKERKEKRERKEWADEEGNIKLKVQEYKKKKKKDKNEKITRMEEWSKSSKKRNNGPENNIKEIVDSLVKQLPDSNKSDFLSSLTARGSLNCKDMNLSDLSINAIKAAGHYKVFKVDLSYNNFSFVPTRLKDLFNHLKELSMSNNNLKTIPDFFGSMTQLRTLDVSSNQLESFPLSMCDCNIITLNARDNCLTKVPKVLYSIHTLENVNFSRNKIKTIDVHGIKNWKRLTYLNLRSNLIKSVPYELGFLMSIRTLDLLDNPMKNPNPQILKSGTSNILKHLRFLSFKQCDSDLKNMVLF